MERIVKINNRNEYDVLLARFDTLALSIKEPPQDENAPIYIEMKRLANLIEQYEDAYLKLHSSK